MAYRFNTTRQRFEHLCAPLELDDYGLQSMAEASPPKWHLAHVSWFFETFILKPYNPVYQLFQPQFEYLFNSYYNGIGAQYPRSNRGMLSRPTVDEVYEYRAYVDQAMLNLLQQAPDNTEIARLTELGIHHEQQHQELFLADLKHHFFQNPLFPEYLKPEQDPLPANAPAPLSLLDFDGGLYEIGYAGNGFCFDNEQPRHKHYLEPFTLANRLITNAEYLAFIEDGGYQQPHLWLSDGWNQLQQQDWRHPLYWVQRDGQWFEFGLNGLKPLDPHQPVCHVSYYEADAFARWLGKRLPREQEWEVAAREVPAEGNFMDNERFHPSMDYHTHSTDYPTQMFGDLWEWTQSPYQPYPGYQPAAGAVGEYNGKFMCNQMVLRGGSCATPANHIRSSYRNFFYPPDRWQFMGIRLAD